VCRTAVGLLLLGAVGCASACAGRQAGGWGRGAGRQAAVTGLECMQCTVLQWLMHPVLSKQLLRAAELTTPFVSNQPACDGCRCCCAVAIAATDPAAAAAQAALNSPAGQSPQLKVPDCC
jgi:hypothetical protein